MKALRKNQKTMLGALALFLLSGGVAQAQVTLFTSPCDETYNSVTQQTQTNVPHRIPAIVETANGNVLVFADKRWGYGDIGQHDMDGATFITCNGATSSQIDIMVRRSKDLGATWEEQKEQVSIATSGSDASGDVAVVANRENRNEILVMTAGGDIYFTDSKNSAGNRLQIRRYYSNNGGQSWGTTYTDMTEAIYNEVGCDGIFFSSGRILQSTFKNEGANYYRLYAALATNTKTGTWGTTNTGATYVVYSDDFGATWHSLGKAISNGDEAKVEELPNGNIVVSAKNTSGTRKFNIYDGNKWLSDGGVAYEFNTTDACNGEILIVPVNNNGVLEHYVLQSMPTANGERKDVKIYYKKLTEADQTSVTSFATSGWCSTTNAYMLASGTAAYSTMIIQSNGKIGAAYEKNAYACGGKGSHLLTGACDHATGYDIMYNSIDIADIINVEGAEIIPNIEDLFGEDESGNTKNTIAKKMNLCSNSAHTQSAANYSWASLYLPISVQLPDGVTAYKVTGISDDQTVVNIEALSGQVVPAGEAVVLRDDQKRAEIQLTLAAPQTASTDNLLKGCFVESINITDDNYTNYYVLSHGSQCEAFYYPQNGYLQKWLAYLPLPQSQSATLMLRIKDGETTAIEQISLEQLQDNAPIFDLSGRRVQDATVPGIYIQGGKKFIVK